MGIYIHIPFCRKACTYCDFHFSTKVTYAQRMVDAIVEEIRIRKHEHPGVVQSIYFGGGTPSVLSKAQIRSILGEILNHFNVDQDTEITLEANPDDLTLSYLQELKETGINRLSIGIQSFDEDVLRWMNRSHTAHQAFDAIKDAQNAGFENITADLISGIPGKGAAYWNDQLKSATELNINHLSIYSLTIEEQTILNHRIKKGLQAPPAQEEQAAQFSQTTETLTGLGYEHYEISNYAKPGYRSRHNSSYWTGTAYLGLGPSAHSYDGNSIRSWNISNNHLYMESIESGVPASESETLEPRDKANEFIMIRLRTSDGLSIDDYHALTGYSIHEDLFKSWINSGHLTLKNNTLQLTGEGKLMADAIASSLFIL